VLVEIEIVFGVPVTMLNTVGSATVRAGLIRREYVTVYPHALDWVTKLVVTILAASET